MRDKRCRRWQHNAAPQLWISRVDADARQLSNGDAIKIYNDRGEFGATAHITDDVPPGVVWIRDGWVGLNHLTSGDAVLTGEALSLFHFFGRSVELWRSGRSCSGLEDCKILRGPRLFVAQRARADRCCERRMVRPIGRGGNRRQQFRPLGRAC
jgi:hypothetical protein